jgi:hypothetical protein
MNIIQVYRKYTLFKVEVVGFEHPKVPEGEAGREHPDVLLYNFEGMSITLRAKKILYRFEWWEQFDTYYIYSRLEGRNK